MVSNFLKYQKISMTYYFNYEHVALNRFIVRVFSHAEEIKFQHLNEVEAYVVIIICY